MQHYTRDERTQVHDEVISFLADCIYKAFKNVNYDHISTTTPKQKEITLYAKKKHIIQKFDISFIYESKLVLIEVKTEGI